MRVTPQRKRKTARSQAVLERDEVQRLRRAAEQAGYMEHALFEWIYTNGTRASEPGVARTGDVDLRGKRVQLVHLKGGQDPDWIPLASTCAAALRAWFENRNIREEKPEQRDFIFPSENPGRCYPCKGKGEIKKVSRKTKVSAILPCQHCDGCGTRWGLTRHEVRHLLDDLFEKAKIPEAKRFPHILRHSAVTHMMEKMTPAAVQERVGHAHLTTTLGYAKATKAARDTIDQIFGEED